MGYFKTAIDNIEQGILICDSQSRIEYFNASYGNFIGKELDDVRGKLLTEVRPGAAAPKVLVSGQAIQSLHRIEDGEDYFADIYPIKEDGKVVGTLARKSMEYYIIQPYERKDNN